MLSRVAMQLNQFIIAFFASKRVSFLTAFLCWESGRYSDLCRAGRDAGMRIRLITDVASMVELPAYDAHREGVVLDVACPHAALVLDKASSSRAFIHRYTWLLLHDASYNGTVVEDTLDETAILPDADVTWASADGLADVYRVKADQPLIVANWGLDRSRSRDELEAFWARQPAAAARRKNLHSIHLKADVIVSQPQHFKGWSDLSDRQIDTFPKLTYPIMMLAAEDLNFRYNLHQIDLYGEERNGSFDGLCGRLERGQAEIGVASMFLRPDRLRVVHFCAETVELRGAFMFRQPTQASVSNVFVLPLSRGVWLAAGAVFTAAGALLALLPPALAAPAHRADPALARLTPAEAFTFVMGTVCQQGFHVSPSLWSARLAIYSALLLALFAFTAYSAKVVAILQAPSDAIRSIDDLARSPFTCGVQDTTYKKVYFAESRDPATQRLYRKKLLPLGDAAYLSVVDGIARMRTGLFAFQVEESAGYEVVSRTFTEREKCGLQQVQAFRLPMVAVPARKHSGYRDLLAARIRWQREVGVMQRARRTWMAERARCDAGAGGFVSVTLRDVMPLAQILCMGTVLSVLLLVAEMVVNAHDRRKKLRRQ